MSRPAASGPPLRALRRGILVLLAVLVAAIGGLFLLGRQEARPPVEKSSGRNPEGRSGGRHRGLEVGRDTIAWSEGFEFEQRVGEESAFALRGERFATDREGVTSLEGVELMLTREGEPYRVTSRRATWNGSTREARLTGNVRLSGGTGLWLEAPRLDLTEGGQVVVSRDPVRFGSEQGISGRANQLRFDFENDRLLLHGRVHATDERDPEGEPFELDAEEVDYPRLRQRLIARGNVELVSGSDRLKANEIEVELAADSETPRRATARGQVAGGVEWGEPAPTEEGAEEPAAEPTSEPVAGAAPRAAGSPASAAQEDEDEEELGGAGGRIRFRSSVARVELGGPGGSISAVELEGDEAGVARIGFREATGGVRTLRAPTISAVVEAGALREAHAEGGVQIRERLADEAGRRTASAERADAGFTEQGELATLRLEGQVQIREPDLRATGELAEIDAVSGAGLLKGGARRARAESARGEILAPEIRFERDGGSLHARGGVLATLASEGDSRLRLGPATGGDEKDPIRVEAGQADWDDAERSWHFAGDVRAAQGDRLLFAEELAGSEASGDLSASGGVRTLWKQPGEAGAPSEETAISAHRLDYRSAQLVVEYTGEVRVRQSERELQGESLVVELDEEHEARKMTATGSVRLTDRRTGRTVQGSRAVHDLAADAISIEGEPVILREADGTTLRGPRLLYDVATGSARMQGTGEGS